MYVEHLRTSNSNHSLPWLVQLPLYSPISLDAHGE